MKEQKENLEDIDLLRFFAILFHARVRILVCGVAGFLVAIIISVIHPKYGVSTLTIMPLDSIQNAKLFSMISEKMFLGELNIEDTSKILLKTFISRLDNNLTLDEYKALTITDNKKGGFYVKVRNKSPKDHQDFICSLHRDGESFAKDVEEILGYNVKTMPIPYRIVNSSYLEHSGYYSLNMVLGIFSGFIIGSIYTLIKYHLPVIRKRWVNTLSEIKRE